MLACLCSDLLWPKAPDQAKQTQEVTARPDLVQGSTLFTTQDLEIGGFLECSTIVNRHPMQAFQSSQLDSFVPFVVRTSHGVSREL